MKSRLQFKVVPVPISAEEARRAEQGFLNVLADALADRLIAKARAEIAAELGVDEDSIDCERDRDARELGLTDGLTGFGDFR